MIITNIDGYDYRISFKHDGPGYSPRTTTCSIEKVTAGGRFKDDGQVIATGIASCDSRDNFDKSIGRRLSMKRAMNKSNFSRAERIRIWEAYLDDKYLVVA